MLLTVFYMISTWVQAWKLSSLKARFTAVLNLGLDTTKPSIMFYIKPLDIIKDETIDKKEVNYNDLLSSHLCSNKSIAKLGDLLWCQGDKRLCTIYPLQKIDVNEWLLYVPGQLNFPLYMNTSKTIEQPKLMDDTKMHVLIEADIENYNPNAFFELTKLENYGYPVAWTVDKLFAIIIETDIDHLIKLSIGLMQKQCYINNGMLVKRIESVILNGKPCSYNIGQSIIFCDKKLVGKAQWQEHINKLKLFSSTARHVAQNGNPFEIDTLPGIIIHPGCQIVCLQMPVILNINKIDNDDGEFDNDNKLNIPITPPPTPAFSNELDCQSSVLTTQFNHDNITKKLIDKIVNENDKINNEIHMDNKIVEQSIPQPSTQKKNKFNKYNNTKKTSKKTIINSI